MVEVKNGKYESYHKNGNLQFETNYLNGKLEGIQKVYYSSGELFLEKNFKDGLQDGPSKGFSKNGEVLFEKKYQKGVEVEQENPWTKKLATKNKDKKIER